MGSGEVAKARPFLTLDILQCYGRVEFYCLQGGSHDRAPQNHPSACCSHASGLPGIFGGLSAFVVSGIDFGAQLTAIVVTVVIAACSGLVSGKVIAILGRRTEPYVDSEEFEDVEEETAQPDTAVTDLAA
ncbi:MAG: hypothetical protein C0617_14255 [Desulfuromonas sp.]|uniref:hypothetical protein n=1 Tax=Desulfuromonas sp. TaxID=892 RepID=UPI000CBCD927|nr:hypothetical protein [Desulfuromonas sp.]PLX82288.1 MAG: hypothetical protein C0617_14255 [Desulfuromonas sp.]